MTPRLFLPPRLPDTEQVSRRVLLAGLGALICAPAIVRASSLMPVKAWKEPAFLAIDLGQEETTAMVWFQSWPRGTTRPEFHVIGHCTARTFGQRILPYVLKEFGYCTFEARTPRQPERA